MKFYYFPFLANPGALNMSIDRNLFEESKKNGSVHLRFYIWSPPAISFGRNQKLEGVVNLKECKKNNVELVKRPTGGRALLHHKELTFFLSGPLDEKIFPKNFQENYNFISLALLKGLKNLKIPAEIKKSERPYKTSPLSPLPCFSEPAPGEIVVEGKKIIGSAMAVEEEFFLIHGSIIIDFDEKLQKKCFLESNNFSVSKIVDFLNPLPSWNILLKSFKRGFEEILKIKLKKRGFSKNFIEKASAETSSYKIIKP